jgi:hypothetical protein
MNGEARFLNKTAHHLIDKLVISHDSRLGRKADSNRLEYFDTFAGD